MSKVIITIIAIIVAIAVTMFVLARKGYKFVVQTPPKDEKKAEKAAA